MRLIVDDNIIVKGEICAAGSHMLANFRPPFQAEAVDRALAAGYSLCGRANIDEFAMAGTGETCYAGATENPLAPGCVTSGAAAALQKDEADVALTVDCGGQSLRQAAFANIKSFRPTYGSISRFGIIANISSTEQMAGAAKTLADAAKLVEAVAGHDAKDATSRKEAAYPFSVNADVKGKKIALLLPAAISDGMKEAVTEAAAALTAAGASVAEATLPYAEYAPQMYTVMAAAEGCNNISRFDGVKYGYRTAQYKDTEELYRKSRTEAIGSHAKAVAILGTYVLSKGRYEQYYHKALQARRLLTDAWKALFENFDAALMPLSFDTAYALGADSAEHLAERDLIFTAPAALAGLPAAGIPWEKDGKYYGLQLVAASGCDENALAAAAVLEGGAN